MKIKQAVILAGGQGTRLRPLTLTTPKPLIPINGKPFVQYLVERLKENGITEILFLIGYLGEHIEKYFGDGKEFGLHITYSYSPVEYETGARIRDAIGHIDDTFLLVYCDNYWPLNLKKLEEVYKKAGTHALVTVYANQDNYTRNNMLVNEKGIVEVYDKTRQTAGLNGVDIGFFILQKSLLSNLPKENFSFEKVVLPDLINKKQLTGFMTQHKYYGLSNLERISTVKKFFASRKVVFLDRDGVLNKKAPKSESIRTVKDFELLPQAIPALQYLQKKAYDIFVITNQAGIARQLVSEKEVNKMHEKFLKICKENGVTIKGIYYCPHGWDDGCFCRKPNPGMLFKAAEEHDFDLTKATFIGDDERDVKAGKAANCRTILMEPDGNLLSVVQSSL